MRILYVTPEIFPLLKTGGLADVSGALPAALRALGHDVRLLLPGHPKVMAGLGELTPVEGVLGGMPGADQAAAHGGLRLWLGTAPDGVPAYVLDAPALFDRPGNPYMGPDGKDWPDNGGRFAVLAWAAACFAGHGVSADPFWRPEVIHGHDWQTGLVPAYLKLRRDRFAETASVLTIHNIAYQGMFPAAMLGWAGLPSHDFHIDGLEYYGALGFLKAGCRYADRLTTVSPSYAHEIQTDEHGMGLQGLLATRADALTGILNGVDYAVWDPATDPYLPAPYSADDMAGKAACKAALQAELGLEAEALAPLACVVSRLTWHKGLDLVIAAADDWLDRGGQLAVLGTGEPGLEAAFRDLARRRPGRAATHIGYDEGLSHRLMAGSDMILVPSRSEPCGLTQLYGLKYGALPLVRRTGGLADTVVDANTAALNDIAHGEGAATGFQFVAPSAQELTWRLRSALALYRRPEVWAGLRRRAMTRDFGWSGPAKEYAALYAAAAG
jgi:starch synthase